VQACPHTRVWHRKAQVGDREELRPRHSERVASTGPPGDHCGSPSLVDMPDNSITWRLRFATSHRSSALDMEGQVIGPSVFRRRYALPPAAVLAAGSHPAGGAAHLRGRLPRHSGSQALRGTVPPDGWKTYTAVPRVRLTLPKAFRAPPQVRGPRRVSRVNWVEQPVDTMDTKIRCSSRPRNTGLDVFFNRVGEHHLLHRPATRRPAL